MFALTSIEHRYDAALVLRIDAWAAAPGEHWLLSGPSGSGKTTLLHVLAGLTVPTAGTVSVGGVDLATLSGSALDRWRGCHVGLVPQRLHLVGALDVLGNLALARYLAGLPADAGRARELLDAMGIGELGRRYPRQLSQGQAQRVAIARAVINRPTLVLADEPTANLDDAQARAALELLCRQAEAVSATLVIASHDARVRGVLPAVYALPSRVLEPA
jgi:ABC-type lipoprotein export system ATPase subunit